MVELMLEPGSTHFICSFRTQPALPPKKRDILFHNSRDHHPHTLHALEPCTMKRARLEDTKVGINVLSLEGMRTSPRSLSQKNKEVI